MLAVVGHFFLFCNVVRLRRTYELVWAAAYVVATGVAIAVGLFDAWIPLAGVTPLTALSSASNFGARATTASPGDGSTRGGSRRPR